MKSAVNPVAIFEAIPGNNVLLKANCPTFTVEAITQEYSLAIGKPREAVVGKGFFEVFLPNTNDPANTVENDLRESLEQVIRQKKIYLLPTQRYDVANEKGVFVERYWTASNSPVLNEEGNVTYIIHSVTDITGQVLVAQREEKIKGMEQADKLFTQAPFAIHIFKGRELVIEMANKLTLELWGKTEDVVGKNFLEALPELKGMGYEKLMLEVMETGQPKFFYEVPLPLERLGKDSIGYFNFVYQPYSEKDNSAASGVLVFAHEVTEQVVLKRKTSESEQSLALAVEIGRLGIFGMDLQTNLGSFSQQISDWFGLSSPATMSRILSKIHPEDRAMVAEKLANSAEGVDGGRHDIIYRVQHPASGATQYLRSIGEAQFDGDDLINISGILQDVSEQIVSRKKLEESELKFRNLIEEAAVASCLFVGRELRIEVANKTMISYWSKDESVIGKPLKEAVPELQGQPFFQILDEVCTTGKAYEAKAAPAELAIKGVLRTYYFDFTYKPLLNTYNEVYAVVYTAIDVTEQVLSLQKIEEAEERARLSIDAAELGTFEVNLLTNEIVFSKRINEIFGVDGAASLEGYRSVLHPDDVAVRDQAHKEADETGLLEYEVRVILNESSLRWVRMKGKIYYDRERIPIKLFGVAQDITSDKSFFERLEKQVKERTAELDKTHQSLMDANTYLQRIINVFNTPLQVLEPVLENEEIIDFRYKITNCAYAAYANTTPDKLYGKKVSQFFPGYYQTEIFDKAVETYKTGVPSTWQNRYNADGLDIYIEMSTARLGAGVVVHFTDFTRLQHLQFDLQKKVEELERSNRNLEEFANAASHDLKEPIRKIQIFTGRLKTQLSKQLNENDLTTFSRIESASRRMGNLVDDLLQYSHVTQTLPEMEWVDLNQKLQVVLEDLELDIQEKAAVIYVPQLPIIKGYTRQIQQLFQNLISNALKYCRTGVTPEITITVDIVDEDGQPYHCIAVKDNGIGFEQQHAEKIFQMFSRLHAQSEYSGTGVGLSIVKKVIENHNGIIRAKSRLGDGATFKVFLPVNFK